MALKMTHDELLQRISVDPAICGGKPCIRGHRIWVSLILDLLSSGESIDDILKDYPQLNVEDVRACLAYASEMTRERTVELASPRATEPKR
ncbi:MAG: DUF433 domain-containing protein [Myxococcales bacterium]